jgi:hemolysin type calcium-binding protein/WD40 repeat protein
MRRLAFAAVIALALAAAPAAQAAFPGQNGKIAFAKIDGNFDQIFTINPDGTGEMELTSSSDLVNAETPNWSPDGQKIVFCRGQCFQFDPNSEIWVMNADGTDQHKVPNTGSTDFQPAFVDNSHIVFVRFPNTGRAEIWVINADGTGATQLTTPPSGSFDQNPTSSPNGQTIAFSRSNTAGSDAVIYTVSSSPPPGTATPITNNHGMNDIIDDEPNFSPGGGTIAFQRCPAIEGCSGTPSNLFTVPAGGGLIMQITNSTQPSDGANCQPAYAPDGSRIVFAQFPGFDCQQATSFSAPAGRAAVSAQTMAFIGPGGGAVQPFTAGIEPDWQPLAVPPAAGGGAGAAAKPDLGKCFGHDVTIAGTNGPDKITGTPGPDVIHGYRGKDEIDGLAGDDILCGGRGKDKILGKAQDDILIGGKGADYLNGGAGQNRLFGGTPGAKQQDFNNVCVNGPNDKLTNCQTVK